MTLYVPNVLYLKLGKEPNQSKLVQELLKRHYEQVEEAKNPKTESPSVKSEGVNPAAS